MINRDATHSSRAINWALNLGGEDWLDASLDRDGQATHFRGTPNSSPTTCSGSAPNTPDLVLVHDADGTLHRISTTTTHAEVLDML